MVLSIVGAVDALCLLLGLNSLFAQAFSIVEVLCLPVSMALIVLAKRHDGDASLAWLYLAYQLALNLAGVVLLQQGHPGQGIEPPMWLLSAALVFYSAFSILIFRQYLSVK